MYQELLIVVTILVFIVRDLSVGGKTFENKIKKSFVIKKFIILVSEKVDFHTVVIFIFGFHNRIVSAFENPGTDRALRRA